MASAANLIRIKFLITAIFIFANLLLRAQTPVASFIPDKLTGCGPLMVNFNNTSTGAISYKWDFGNSNSSTATNPSTVFISAGTYTVKLVATSANGNKDSTTINITVVANPIADFNAPIVTGCDDDNSISFTNLSTNSVSYIWDFGDGTSSTLANPNHTYNTPGVYSVKLIATSSFGCQNIKIANNYITIFNSSSADFNSTFTSSCDINTLFQFNATSSNNTNWQWNFGDGSNSTQQNPTHQFSSPGSYTITLITTNNNGCIDTLTKPNYITIGNNLIPSFTMSDTAGCGPLNIDFNCTVPNATSWSWDFGNGNTSSIQNPSQTFNNPGSYNITLTVTTQSGCNGTITIPNLVIVDAIPVPSFSVVQDSGCAPFTAQLINNSVNATSFFWEFGTLITSTASNPSITFSSAGNLNVTLTATSANGCSASLTKNQFIKIFDPNAGFSATPRVGCPGLSVQFTSASTQTNIVSYLWNFGDGSFSILQNPQHTYNSTGSFPVSLIVTNNFGCKDTVYRANYITIIDPLTPYTLPDTIKICLGDPYTFVDPSTGSNLWDWNFGDGSTSSIQNPSYTYQDTGIFIVTLTTSISGACSRTYNPFAIVQVIPYIKKLINLNVTSPCKPYVVNFSNATPNVISYLWAFGDGQTSTLPNPIHTYLNSGTYGITLTLTIGAGCITQQDTSITLGHPNPIQISSFDFCVNTDINFWLNDSIAFTSAEWDFGDGNSAVGFTATHQYALEGNYNPTLYSIDTAGCKDTFQLSQPLIANNPIPDFTVGNQIVCLGSALQFNNLSTNATSYLWDFGNGQTSTDSAPNYIYTAAGTYTVSLTVTKGGCTLTATKIAYITVVDPQCDFTFTTNGMCMPVTINLSAISPTAVSWLWDFGNGTTSTLQNPNYTFLTTPFDSLSLTITDINGCSKTKIKENVIYYNSNAAIDDSTGCLPHIAQFTDLSNGALTWLWNFGDGTTSTLQNPSHAYASDGIYNITLICTFPGNCIDTTVFPAMLSIQSPNADFYTPTTAGCSPSQISFINTSLDAVNYDWRFGDGGSSTNVNPSHIYYLPGTYTITLIATNSFGCIDTTIKPQYIFIPGTYSNFSISSIIGCENLNATFTDSSINATTWSWNFGDGYIDTVPYPSHIYQDTGSYVVTLITTDSLGCNSSFTYPLPVNVYPDPIANASVTNTTGCSFFNTDFINQSLGGDAFLWNFGDNDTSTLVNPNHTYLTGGIYQPYLIAITQYGCRDTFTFMSGINVLQSPIATISSSDSIACDPAIITFTDSSQFAISPTYQWNLGNGNVSTNNSITTSYIGAGNYTASLVITNNNGCRDTSYSTIEVLASPEAIGSVNINEGCHPLQTTFTNSSINSTNHVWYFGNGDSSSTNNPIYTYNIPGNYNPFLVVYNSIGCTDTMYLSTIKVHATPIASIIPDLIQGCNPTSITFTNNSSLLENPTYIWNFADGNTSSAINPAHIFQSAGNYQVTLEVTNTFGCQNSTYTNITINPTPIANGTINTVSGCSPLNIVFTNNSVGADSITWDYGNSIIDTNFNTSYLYQFGGTYNPILIATTNLGCADTFQLPTITVNQSPIADFISNVVAGCKNEIISFTNTTTQTTQTTYQWDFGFTNSTQTNPTITYINSGIYDITLIANNSNGCSDTITKLNYIQIFDSLPPPADPIMSVSVLNNSQVEITWANSNVNDLKAYKIYRLNPITGQYILLFTDTNPISATITSYSKFIDSGLNTLTSTYTYKVQTIDICDNTLPLDSLNPHTTININAQQSGGNIQVNWTPYIGCTLTSYELYRTEISNNTTVLVATIPSNTTNYLDTTLSCPIDYSYRVTATELAGSTFTSQSDTSISRPINIYDGQKVEIVRSTVIDNKNILTEWLPPIILPNRVLEYQIYRSEDNINFNLIAIVPSALNYYTDELVDVNAKEYYYKVTVVNDCNLTGDKSNLGTSIFLEGNHSNYRTTLKWTNYQEWSQGVDTYQIERLDANGKWELVKIVNGTTTNITIDE